MPEDYVLGRKKNNIYDITLNRPAKRNAMLFEMLPTICEHIEAQILDPDIRVIIIKGAGKVFSAGCRFHLPGHAGWEVDWRSGCRRRYDPCRHPQVPTVPEPYRSD